MFYSFDQLGELGRLSTSMKKLEKELKNTNKYDVCCPCQCINSSKFRLWWISNYDYLTYLWTHYLWVQNEQYRAKLQKSNERTLALVKASIDIVVAVGLLQLAPKKVTPRVTGAFGFVSSLISCYQVPASIVIFRFLHAFILIGWMKSQNSCLFYSLSVFLI